MEWQDKEFCKKTMNILCNEIIDSYVLMFICMAGSVLCTGYPGNVPDYSAALPMMTATTDSVFLNLLVKNEPEDLTGHRERQGKNRSPPIVTMYSRLILRLH